MSKTPARTAKKKKPAAPASSPKSNTAAAPAPQSPAAADRRVKVRAYKSFRLEKKVKRETSAKLPSGFTLLRGAFGVIKRNWKVMLGISIIYGLLTAALITGFSAVNLDDAKQSFSDVLGGQLNQVATGLSLFMVLLGSSGGNASTPAAGVYQVVLGVVISLATIWTLRQLYAGNVVRIRDGFYKGMYPLVQFILVLVVIGLQLLPLVAGAGLYQLVANNGIAATAVEHILWLTLFLLLAVLSIYMVCSSFFALYIVSLPDVTPMAALRSAKQLVLHRRWMVIRRVLFLPLALIVLSAIVLIPVILLSTAIAPIVFFILSSVLLVVVHSYLYALYKAML